MRFPGTKTVLAIVAAVTLASAAPVIGSPVEGDSPGAVVSTLVDIHGRLSERARRVVVTTSRLHRLAKITVDGADTRELERLVEAEVVRIGDVVPRLRISAIARGLDEMTLDVVRDARDEICWPNEHRTASEHPLAPFISAFVSAAKAPGTLVRSAQDTIVALATALPTVLRAVL